MDGFQYALLKEVKGKFEVNGGRPRYQVEPGGPEESARQFYLGDLDDNLVEPMSPRHIREYDRGSGNELENKMRALRSSSAMTFNLLGNGSCVLGPNDLGVPAGAYSIEYERQAPTLARNGGLPANLDAWLEPEHGQGAVVACEMKMMEWLTSAPSPLKETYFEPGNYPDGAGEAFTSAARMLQAEGLRQYDWPQMFKHSLALYNQMGADGYDGWVRTLVLLNVVWEPANPTDDVRYARRYFEMEDEEHGEFRRFKEIMLPVRRLFLDSYGIDFRIKYRSAADFIAMLEMDASRRAKLERYR